MTEPSRPAPAGMPAVVIQSAQNEQDWINAHLRGDADGAAWRIGSYQAPAVVLGCAQASRYASTLERARSQGVEIVQRSSGGGAVLAGPGLLSMALVLPAGHRLVAEGPMAAYRWLGCLHAGVLRDAGLQALAVAPAAIGPRPGPAWACYGGLSPWEVTVHGRKIVGLAQRRAQGKVLLVSGTLVHTPDWALLCRMLGEGQADAEALRLCTVAVNALTPFAMPVDALAWRLRSALDDVLAGHRLPADRGLATPQAMC